MAKRREKSMERVPLEQADIERFHRNAPAALARRGREFFLEQTFVSLEWILIGSVPILGMLLLGWSGEEMLAFLLVSCWSSFVCDVFRCIAMYASVVRSVETANNDWHVWIVTNVLRTRQGTVSKDNLRAQYSPAQGLFIDIVFGGVGSIGVIALTFETNPEIVSQLLSHRAFVYSVFAFVALQLVRLIWEIVQHGAAGHENPTIKMAAGPRGVLLFLLMFLILIVREYSAQPADTIRLSMMFLNGGAVFLGLLNMIGIWGMATDARWLRTYLAEKGLVRRQT